MEWIFVYLWSFDALNQFAIVSLQQKKGSAYPHHVVVRIRNCPHHVVVRIRYCPHHSLIPKGCYAIELLKSQ